MREGCKSVLGIYHCKIVVWFLVAPKSDRATWRTNNATVQSVSAAGLSKDLTRE